MADTEKIIRKKYDVPIWHKSNLTIDEAVEYSGIGRVSGLCSNDRNWTSCGGSNWIEMV